MCLGCSFTTMNNQDVVAMLEECWQAVAAGPLEPTDEAKEGFRRCKASLSAELSSLLQDAAAMRWPFVPERWQYKQAVASEDKATLKELVGGHLPQLLTFMRASILAREPMWAASVVFLVDRFLYWADTSRSLLKIAEVLHRRYPATPIAPQLVIRQARLALNSGKLQKAEYILSSLINNSGATGCWVYHADSDRVLVQAVSVQIRGQVLQKLGMWVEAAELIWASLIGLHALPEPDRKGIGASLGLLANILVSMSDADFQAFVAGKQVDQRLLKERGHRLLAAAEAAKMAVVYSQYDSLYVLTGAVTQGTCLLAYSFLPGCGAAEREAVLTEAKGAFEIGLLTKREGEVVTSKQELHTLIKAAYSLTVAHRWLGSARGQVRQASQECQKAVEKLHAYGAAGGGERDALGAEVMGLVGRVKAVLGVEPFVKSDERSFVPDGYRSAEEIPVRFSTDRFSEAMGRFRKHHASVCQARRTSCKAAASGRGVPGCSGPCVTAMKTTTAETLDTDGATEDLRHFANENGPPGRWPDGRTDGGHVDQQCSTELSDGEEVSGATSSEEGGFKGTSKTRSTPRSHSDGAAPFADARTRSKDRDGVTRAGRKAEKWVDQKCLTEVSDEDDRNTSGEGPGSLAGREGEGASGHRERPRTSSGGSSALPSSWEAISSSPDTGSKKARATTRRPVTEWAEVGMDLQGDTKDSDEEDMKAATGSKGCRSNGVGNAMASPRSLRNGPPSLLDSRAISKGKGTVTHAKQRVETWVDQQCATEFSDEEVDGETNNAGGGFKGIGNVGTASSFLDDSLGSNSSWQKLSLSDTGSPVSGGKPTRRPSGNHTEEGWVNLDCPEEVKDQEELGQAGRGFEAMRRAGTSISSLGDSLGSSASWQKLGFSDAGSLSSNGRGGSGCTAKQRADVWVDPQCPTLGSDEEDQRDMGSLPPVRTLKPDYPVNGLQPHPSRPPSSAPNPVPGCKNRVGSEEDQSFLLVELPGGGHGGTPRTSGPTGVPAGDVALRCGGSHMWDVDPAAETEDYVLGDLSMSADSVDLEASAAGLGGPGHFAEPKTFGTVGNAEGRGERDFGKLCLDDYQQPSTANNQSHDRCVGTCMLCSEVPECSPTLTEKDYKALLSGVCHKCLLSRLDIKKTFRLRKHRTAYSALLLKYSKVSDRWTSRETKVYIGDPLGKQGCQRTAFWVQILHQEEVLGSYVGKTYRYEKEIHYHLNDVERQVTAQYYVTEFNKRLYEKSIPAQIFFIPSEVLLILEDDVIADCVTVEPYMLGDFVKLTNNTVYTNRAYEATDYGVAFGHFTYQLSRGTEVVVDLQGWVTDSGKGLTYLTDPQIHSVREGGARSRRGERGIRQFLESQHGPRCNDICEALSLGALQ